MIGESNDRSGDDDNNNNDDEGNGVETRSVYSVDEKSLSIFQ